MQKCLTKQFAEMTRLYHFTSFDSACKIIESGMLRFGKMYRMNDLIESNRIVFEHTFLNDVSKGNGYYAENEMHRYQQICFSQDRECEECLYLGFDLHTMWGLYADKGYGVCLVFDKKRLSLQDGDYANDVTYTDLVPQGPIIRNRSRLGIKAEIWRRRDELFFVKRKEWEHEQEFRVIRRAKRESDDEYLDISKALSFVIICKDYSVCYGESMFEGEYCYDLRHLNRSVPVLVYEYGLDWYTLYEDWMSPIWSEQCGFM